MDVLGDDMLIINNGTPKSGSTWVNKIVNTMLNPEAPRLRWRRKDWENPSIHPTRLAKFIEAREWDGKTVMFKSHIPYAPTLDYLFQPDIRIIVSYRNLPDSIVSLFHHQVRLGKAKADRKERWLRTKGIDFAKKFLRYRNGWEQHSDVLMIPYETMVDDAANQIGRISRHLGLDLSAERLAEISETTQIRLKPGEAPRDGNHTRTGGQSRALEELPTPIYERLLRMDKRAEINQPGV